MQIIPRNRSGLFCGKGDQMKNINRIGIVILGYFLFACANTGTEKIDNSGSVVHLTLSTFYTNVDCTGSIVGTPTGKTYCMNSADVTTAKSTTTCTNKYQYMDTALQKKGQTCVSAGYPLACTYGHFVSNLSQCPY